MASGSLLRHLPGSLPQTAVRAWLSGGLSSSCSCARGLQASSSSLHSAAATACRAPTRQQQRALASSSGGGSNGEGGSPSRAHVNPHACSCHQGHALTSWTPGAPGPPLAGVPAAAAAADPDSQPSTSGRSEGAAAAAARQRAPPADSTALETDGEDTIASLVTSERCHAQRTARRSTCTGARQQGQTTSLLLPPPSPRCQQQLPLGCRLLQQNCS
jgi:hypothetical protein